MAEVKLTTGGAERGAMVLDHYDSDERDRVCRLLTDLAEYCEDAGLAPLYAIAVTAQQIAKGRREGRRNPHEVIFDALPDEA